MGRSVSIPSNAITSVYIPVGELDPDFGWDDFITDLRDNVLKPKFPSFSDTDLWVGREDHAILENDTAYVVVSEYMGLVAVTLALKDGPRGYNRGSPNIFSAKQSRIIKSTAPSFRKLLHKSFAKALHKLGNMSNGEGYFRPVDPDRYAQAEKDEEAYQAELAKEREQEKIVDDADGFTS